MNGWNLPIKWCQKPYFPKVPKTEYEPQELYGIKKLRELILELAVRGLLVPQYTDDEPASVLLEKIRIEKERLIKDGRIKKQSTLPPITEEEKPYALPQGWEWIRLEQLINISSGDGLTSSSMNQDGQVPVYGGNGITGYHDKYNVENKTLVIGRVGYYCGSIHLTTEKSWITDNAFKVTFSEDNVFIYFLYWLLKGTNLKEHENATAQPVISGRKVYPIVVGLPPLQEQHRIVAKVDELMTLCDQLEQQTEQSITVHQQLVETVLNTLTNAENYEAFNKAWQQIADSFNLIFTTEHSIEQLKQAILQLAVMGKIVPQDPDDEPASVLLEKIRIEKERLIKEGRIKKQSTLPSITEEEKPYVLPHGWEWARIHELSIIGTGATPSRTNPDYFYPKEVSWVTSGETGEEFIYSTTEKISLLAVNETNVSICPIGTLIIAMYGQGKTRGQISELMVEAGTNQACATVQLINKEVHHRHFVKKFFVKSYNEIRLQSAGGAQPNLNVGKVSLAVLPIPPLQEQHRIVAKVDELMALCDQLKEGLLVAQDTQIQLTDTLVSHTLN